ncbi:MAG: PAS domain S-box protein [Cellvibrionaceae bacterium]
MGPYPVEGDHLSGKYVVHESQLEGNKTIVGLFTLLLLLAVMAVFGLSQVEQKSKNTTTASLEAAVSASENLIVDVWLKQLASDVEGKAKDIALQKHVHQLRTVKPQQLLEHPAQDYFQRYYLDSLRLRQVEDVFIVAEDGTTLASQYKYQIGKENIVSKVFSEEFERVLFGESQLTPSILVDVEIQPKIIRNDHAMFVLAPIYNGGDTINAVLGVKFDPSVIFSSLIHSSFEGKTGKTYIFNNEGVLIAKSRGPNKVEINQDSESLSSLFHSVTKLELNGRLLFPVRKAIGGLSGSSMDASLNIKGNKVFTAWVWSDVLDLGIATEISEEEALANYRYIQRVILIMLACTLLFSGLYFTMISRGRKRLLKEIESSENYLREILENTHDGIVTVDDKGIVQTFNKGAEALFGYAADEIVGKNVSLLMPDPHRTHHDQYIANYVNTGVAKVIGKGQEVQAKHKQGNYFYVRIAVSKTEVDGEQYFTSIIHDLTEKKLAEDALSQYKNDLEYLVEKRTEEVERQSQKLEMALKAGNVGIWSCYLEKFPEEHGLNRHGMIWDERFSNQLGFSEDDVQSVRAWLDVIHTKDRVSVVSSLLESIENKTPFSCGYRVVLPDDDVRYVSSSGEVVEDEAGKAIRIEGVSYDLTHIKLAEESLKELNSEISSQQALLEGVINATDDFVFVKSAGRYEYLICNNAFAQFVGRPVNEIVGQSDEVWFSGMERFDEVRRVDERVFETGSVQRSTEWLEYPPGRKVLLDTIKYPLKDANGEIIALVGLTRDITQLKKYEEELVRLTVKLEDKVRERTKDLERNQDVLKLTLSSAGAGYWQYDLSGETFSWDEKTKEIFAYKDEEGPLFETWLEEIYDEDRTNVMQDFERDLHDPAIETFSLNFRIVIPLYGLRYIRMTGHVERDDSGVAVGSYGLFFDETIRTLGEYEINEQREIAENANKAKSEFLAVMSHEIRTPMNAIIGMSDLALETALNDKQRNYIDKVNLSAKSLLAIINDILDFSKIESGHLELEKVQFKFDNILDSLINIVGMRAQEKGLEFIFDISGAVPQDLIGDPTRLAQVLINLGGNAVKFTASGEITIRIRVLDIRREIVKLGFEVIDTGIGIDQESQSKLFDEFTQADSSVTREYGGTGLGLSISKRIVEALGGKIGLRSVPGEGSAFYFVIELEQVLDDNNFRPQAHLPDDIENKQVVVVDDNDTSRRVITEMVADLGFNVIGLSSANEAIATLEEAALVGEHYDLALLDWTMPDMDGPTLAKYMSSKSRISETPVVLMHEANNLQAQDRVENSSNIRSLLVKPVNRLDLLSAILKALGGKEFGLIDASINEGSEKEKQEESLHGMKVLLVEDNDINQELALELLGNLGVEVTVASNGQEAVNKIEQEAFDVVLMDIHMPIMDGVAATKYLRSDSRFKQLPIVAMTANALVGDREKYISVGMDDYLSKPINIKALESKLQKWSKGDKVAEVINENEDELPHSLETAPFVIEGIDTVAGLDICNDSVELYKKLLRMFLSNQDFVNNFQSAINKDSLEDAERIAHTLKGVSGNIGAKGIYLKASNLQEACKGGDNEAIRLCLEKLAEELSPLLSRIQSLVDDGTLSEPGKQSSPFEERYTEAWSAEDAQRELRVLLELLEQSDTSSKIQFEKIKAGVSREGESLYSAEDLAVLDEIAEAISSYDFDSALEKAGTLLNA